MWVDSSQDEEQKQNGQVGGTLNVGAGGGTASGQPTGINGNPSTITPVQSNQPQQQFATVQDYLGANKQQGEDLGQKFTSGLTDTASKEKSTIDTAVAGAGNDITAGTTTYNPDLVTKAQADPTSVANSPDDLNSFLKQWNAAYTGPSSFETSTEYAPATAASNEASQNAAEVSSTGGQQQLLHDNFGVYGQGNQGLDQAILQNSSYYPTVQAAAPAFKSIGDYLSSQSTALDAQAQKAQADTDAARTQTQGAFANSLTGFQNDLNTRVAAAQKNAQDTVEGYSKDISSGNIPAVQHDLQVSGADPDTIKSITDYLTELNGSYQIKPNIPTSLLANPSVDINSANVATPQDYAKAAALSQLTGVDYSGVLNPNNAAQAGTGDLAHGAIKAGNVADYLKQGLTTQDQSLVATTPTLNWDAINRGQYSSEDAVNQVQNIVDAGKRQGVKPANNTALNSLNSNAMQGLQAIILGKNDINTRPVAKVYADTAVAAMMGLGQSKEQAQQYINTWIQQLGAQVGTENVPPIYK